MQLLLFTLLILLFCPSSCVLDVFWASYSPSDGILRVQTSLDVLSLGKPRSSLKTMCYLVDDEPPACGKFDVMVKSEDGGVVKT
jgi:hypothetical protein